MWCRCVWWSLVSVILIRSEGGMGAYRSDEFVLECRRLDGTPRILCRRSPIEAIESTCLTRSGLRAIRPLSSLPHTYESNIRYKTYSPTYMSVKTIAFAPDLGS